MAATGRACLQYLLHLAQDNLDFRLPVRVIIFTDIFLSLFLFLDFILSTGFDSKLKLSQVLLILRAM